MTSNFKSGSCGVGFVCSINGIKNHEIVRLGLEAVKNLTHRGAVGADGKTGDGAGILIQMPEKFFSKKIDELGYKISSINNLAVGFFFLYDNCESDIKNILEKYGFKTIGWRDVPVNDDALGKSALSTKPRIIQLLIDTEGVERNEREIRLYLTRRAIEKAHVGKTYVNSLSSKTVVYKGLLVAPQLDRFYPDLLDEDFASAFCMFHQRFSTNTLPDWTLAQPFRILAHNGEINTIQGNRNWIGSLEHEIFHGIFKNDNDLIRPLLSSEESDSASLDRIIELLVLSGFSLEHAVNMCVPPAWECCDFSTDGSRSDAQAFFEFQSLLMKPWDGPAAITFTDGDTIGAHLDRNGLRPLRYILTEDGILVSGSEIGMVKLEGKTIKEKGRLGPGDIISVNTKKGKVKFTEEIIKEISGKAIYKDCINRHLVRLKRSDVKPTQLHLEIKKRQIAFGYTSEEINTSLKEMAEKASELTYSMGDDTPLPPLSEKPQLLFRYFKQRFSQVTNPPIDPIREKLVMSVKMNLGYKRNFLHETPEHAKRLHIESPILDEHDINEIEKQKNFNVKRIPITFPKAVSGREISLLSDAVRKLQEKVVEAVKNGVEIIILSDNDISKDNAAIPSLLAVAASFNALQRGKLVNRASFIVETGEARDIHHIACLIGYGAGAVCPYLAFQTIQEMCGRGEFNVPYKTASANYKKALDDGLLKVIARLGISTINSYHNARLFDTVCLNEDFVNEYFHGTPVIIESDSIHEIEESVLKRHDSGFSTKEPVLDYGGDLRYRKEGQWHAWSPSCVVALNRFIKSGDYRDYKEFSKIANERPVFIRSLLTYKKGNPISIDDVEPEENILKRFLSGAMSVGALSPEAHETIAEACNRLGIRSNSGEGGEDTARLWSIKNSAIKQIASGRFGVTPAYIASAQELEIKIAQGAKPGEGGHLPAHKVTEYIAMLRHCAPDMILISPPPHHDIYSIEDIAQLINDLKQANPYAHVCVKLVAETGVGIVAAGVAKAYADIVQISGCDGGTGASPVSSIKNAGSYWEIGLAETQRILIENGLREKVRVRVDGGLKTGRDIIIAALLGAEEFGFGTAVMIAIGCVMARQCHLNTCPTGIATQDERLRRRYRGRVEGVTAYFRAVAHEVREIMAEMGFRSLDEIIGRTDLIDVVTCDNYAGTRRIKLNKLLDGLSESSQRRCASERNNNPASSINDRILKDLLFYIEKAEPVRREYEIKNTDRSIPLKLNYHIALRYKDEGLPDDTIQLTFRGTAGQSFGAFNHRGLSITLIGDANDYVGKGMYGGRIIIAPSDINESHKHVIVGNTVLYGAIGGEFYAAGKAGERFAVRNSGATAVVEGTGQHLCEYMTRGTVVVLGRVGYNVGAGMTGGIIYIFDEDDKLKTKLNNSYVAAYDLEDAQDIQRLKSLIEDHYRYTESKRAGEILRDLENMLKHFKKVIHVQH
ncbi:MAG: glutamate synthase large subunit [Thermodesulfovibrio sp.]|nr:glutamate synthase large subunit [Thermodesulfovibrio sp.]